jgi:hypothetical protein
MRKPKNPLVQRLERLEEEYRTAVAKYESGQSGPLTPEIAWDLLSLTDRITKLLKQVRKGEQP